MAVVASVQLGHTKRQTPHQPGVVGGGRRRAQLPGTSRRPAGSSREGAQRGGPPGVLFVIGWSGRWRRVELVELTAEVEAAPVLALPISALKTISSAGSMTEADFPFVAAGRG